MRRVMMEPACSSYTHWHPSFYVIVEPSDIAHPRLRIPDSFVQKHGDELLDTVRLIVPTDDIWNVGVEKVGKTIWLNDGFQEFMEHHSIGYWYFLLFKYGHNSVFNVHIFDLTATEIDYQLRSQNPSYAKEKIGCVGDDKESESSVEIVDCWETEQGSEFSSRDKRCRISPEKNIIFGRCYKTRSRTSKLHDVVDDKERESSVEIVDPWESVQGPESLTKSSELFCGAKRRKIAPLEPVSSNRTDCKTDTRKSFTSQQRKGKGGRPRAALDTNRPNVNAAKIFVPKDPHFMQILEEYNVRNSILNIPAKFAREYMPKTSGVIFLQNSDDNKWSIRFIRSNLHVCLSKGWRTFVRDNGLVVGDACVFELIKDLQADQLTLKVHIFRSRVEESILNDINLIKSSEGKSVQRNTETPIYSAEEGGKSAIFQFNGRKLTESSDAFGPVSSNRTNCKTDTRKSFTSQQRKGKRGRPRAAPETNGLNVDAAKIFVPENPHFMQILSKHNVVRNHILYIPADFIRKYLPKTTELIELLQDCDGNKWSTRSIRNKSHVFLSKGWLSFVRDKGLMVGDACVFELIKDLQADKFMLKVHIFRSSPEGNSTD